MTKKAPTPDRSVRIEAEYYHKDGSTVWMENSVKAIRDIDGEMIGLHGISRDISESKRAERKLRDSEKKFSQAFQTSPYAITITRADDGGFVDVNEAFTTISGYTRQEALANSSIGLDLWVNQEDRQGVVDELSAGRQVAGREYQFKTKSGEIITGLFSAQLLALGDVPCVLSSINDITERKLTEDELRKSQEKFAKLYKASPAWLVVSALEDGRFWEVNDAFCEAMGYAQEELVGRTSSELNMWVDIADRQRYLEQMQSKGFVRNFPVQFRQKDGTVRDFLWSAEKIEIEGKSCAMSVLLDVTETNRARAAIEKSEAQYRNLFENINDLVCVHDLEGRLINVNPVASDILGYTREEFLSLKLPDIIPVKYRPKFYDVYMKTIVDKGYAAGVMQMVAKSGQIHFIEYRNRLIRAENQEGPYIAGLARDITESIRAATALKESEAQFRAAFDNAPLGMALIDLERRFLKVNAPLCEMLKYSENELLGISFNQFTHPEDRQGGRDRWEELKSGRASSNQAEKRYLDKDGNVHWIIISNSALKDQQGRTRYIVSHFFDNTRYKSAHEASQRLESQLRQAQKMEAIGTLAGGIAHDFNNILAAVMGYAEITLEDIEQGKGSPEAVHNILEASGRAKGLVNQILTFSRRADAELTPVDLNKEVLNASNLLKQTLPKMIDIRRELSTEIAPVMASPHQMEQILMNLGSNARDAMPDGGTLTIVTSQQRVEGVNCRACSQPFSGEYAVISVRDTGQGIKEEDLDKIFDPFFTTKEIGKGTGLGLSTVFGIVDSYGGHINCMTRLGEGTTFNIYLLPAEERIVDAESDLPEESIEGGQETVLLVDDEPLILDIGSKHLSRVGYKVVTAANGEEALEIFKGMQDEISLVILDLSMPGMGGHRCLQALLSMEPSIKVIVFTGYSRDGDISETLSSGAVALLAKPFSKNEMLKTVRMVLDS